MCKKPIFLDSQEHMPNIPAFKPFAAFEAKHYIKKMAHKIKETLETLEI